MKKALILLLVAVIGTIISIVLGFLSIWILNLLRYISIDIKIEIISIVFCFLFSIIAFFVLNRIPIPKYLTGVCLFFPPTILCYIISERYCYPLLDTYKYTEKEELIETVFYSLSEAWVISVFSAIIFFMIYGASYLLKTKNESF